MTSDLDKAGHDAAAPQEQSPDDSVMGTNSSSIVSKRSVEKLYHPDEPHFFRFFVPKFQRRAPLINRGYFLRLRIIDTIVRRFLEEPSPSPLKKVVINLGCGYDVLPWQCHTRYPDLCRDVLFVDVDFPDLMAKKRQVVLSNPELSHLLGSHTVGDDHSPIFLRSKQYCQIGCDLRQLDLLQSCLADLIGSSTSEGSFLFVAEVSITYLETLAADQVIQWASTLENSKFCILEQMLPHGPDHPFAQNMMKHFNKLSTPLKSIHRYPTVSAQEERFRNRGWSHIQAWTLWQAWADDYFMSPTDRKSLDDIEPFDEWEELALFGSHYIALLASTHELRGVKDPGSLSLSYPRLPALPSAITFSGYPSERVQRRFAAAMIVDGGSGTELVANVLGQGTSSRLESFDIHGAPGAQDSQLDASGWPSDGPSARVCHTLTDMGASGSLLVGGRASPANAFRDCWFYEKRTHGWRGVQNLPVPLYRHTVIRLGSSDFALLGGGKTDHHRVSPEFYLYHPEKGWLLCETRGVAPKVFGCVLTQAGSSDPGSYQGSVLGGLLEDGVINEQTFTWMLNISEPTPLLEFTSCGSQSEEEEDAGTRPILHRFGAHHARVGDRSLLLGGVVSGQQLPRDFDMLIIENECSSPRAIARVVDEDSTRALRPFIVGSSVAIHQDGRFSIIGGGATCFAMGSFWSQGNYTVRPDLGIPRDGGLPPTDGVVAGRPLSYLQTAGITPVAEKTGS